MRKTVFTLFCALMLTVGCAASALAAEAGNLIGYVNVQQVFRSYPDIQTTMSVVDLERQKAQNEFASKAPSLDDKGKQELSQKLSEQIAKKEQSLMEPIQKKIRKAIEKVAKAQGIANVVDSSAMVFGGKDLTNDVIAEVSSGK